MSVRALMRLYLSERLLTRKRDTHKTAHPALLYDGTLLDSPAQ
jgi:hypothetical protein